MNNIDRRKGARYVKIFTYVEFRVDRILRSLKSCRLRRQFVIAGFRPRAAQGRANAAGAGMRRSGHDGSPSLLAQRQFCREQNWTHFSAPAREGAGQKDERPGPNAHPSAGRAFVHPCTSKGRPEWREYSLTSAALGPGAEPTGPPVPRLRRRLPCLRPLRGARPKPYGARACHTGFRSFPFDYHRFLCVLCVFAAKTHID